MSTNHYDVIIIGSGAGGGTLAYKLAPSGKRILLVERGPYVPREKENWDSHAVNTEARYHIKDAWLDRDGKEFHAGAHYFVGGNTKFYGAALIRLRREDFGNVRHYGGSSPAWPIAYEELEPYYTAAEHLYQVHGERGVDPTEPPRSEAKPTSPGRRFQVSISRAHLHKGAPESSLVVSKNRTGARNNYGRQTVRHQGGGHKQKYRVVDFLRNKDGVPGRVERIEYDPNRTAHLALVLYADGERRYIIAPKGVVAGDSILSGAEAPIKAGNALQLRNIPIGTTIHCVELKPGRYVFVEPGSKRKILPGNEGLRLICVGSPPGAYTVREG